jgi:hypothetical protein
LTIASAAYGPEPAQIDPIAFGEAETTAPPVVHPLAPATGPAPFGVYTERASTAPTPVTPAAAVGPAEGTLADLDCRYDADGRRAPIPLDRLVAVMRTGIDALGPNPAPEQVRALVQSELSRGGGDSKLKLMALTALEADYKPTTPAGAALLKPFDLSDAAMVYSNGYDPCGNPAATGGGGAFGQGPFANDFATINPVPVIAARGAAITEGGPI